VVLGRAMEQIVRGLAGAGRNPRLSRPGPASLSVSTPVAWSAVTSIRIRFVFDYVDPGSYLVRELLARWSRERNVRLDLVHAPLELVRPPAARPSTEDPAWRRLQEAMRTIAAEKGIPFSPPASVPWTRKAHELAFHAEEKGCFDAVHRSLFEAYFHRARDIGRVDVLVELAREQGLDPSETRVVLGVDRFLSSMEEGRERLLGEGFRGVPTLESNQRRLEGFTDVESLYTFLDTALADPLKEH